MTTVLMMSMLVAGQVDACPPIALLRGASDLVDEVRVELERRGIRSTPATGCDALSVLLEPRGEAIFIEIESAGLRRMAADAERAGSTIESWVRTDVTAPLLDRELPPETKHPIKPERDYEVYVSPKEVEPPPALREFALSLGPALGLATDASRWVGVDLRGCYQVWRLCIGGRLQYALDVGEVGPTELLDGDRSIFDAGAIVDVPVLLGDFELVPGIGVGLAVIRSIRELDTLELSEFEANLRLRAQLGLSWRATRSWSLRLDVAADYMPAARDMLRGSIDEREVELPGEPELVGWARLALEVGGL